MKLTTRSGVFYIVFFLFLIFVNACTTESPDKLYISVPAQVVSEDGTVSSGVGQLWLSPRLDDALQQEGYARQLLADPDLEPDRYILGTIEDKDGRLWTTCYDLSVLGNKTESCSFSLYEDICHGQCIFDLKVRTKGALDVENIDRAPWENESEDTWVSDSVDWAAVAKRDKFYAMLNQSSDIRGFPAIYVRVVKDTLAVELFPNRSSGK